MVPYEKLVEEDLNLGTGAVDVTMPGGGTATGHKVNPSSFQALGFAATAPGTQSLAASTLTVVQFTSEEFDTKSWFDNVTNFAFTPQKAGYYDLKASLALASFTGTLTLGIYKNGVLVDSVAITCTAAAAKIFLSIHVAANGSTDTFVVKATQTDSSAKTVSAARFSAACVGGL